MNDFTTTFLNRLKAIRLSDNERLQMRERLALYAQMHPAVEALPTSSWYTSISMLFTSRRLAPLAGALALLLVIGTGTTIAAEGSAPGDSLYSLKIHVNEPLMTALAPTAAGQAKVAASIATRRAEEAVTLASRGTLTPDREAYLSEAFTVSVDKAAVKTDDLEATGNTIAAAKVKAHLAAQLAGEAQALGAVSKDHAASAALLRAVVATTERISGQGSAVVVLDQEEESEESPAIAAEPTEPEAPHPTLMAAKAAIEAAPTTTPTEPPVTGRFSKRIRATTTATTTLEGRLFPGALSATEILLPKADLAVPHIPFLPSPVSETGDSDEIELAP